ncbi:hypothetical protein ACFVQ4_21855 [Streptomyces laurentii]|uniref:hypothetical protein n=1 Tax=Streptomyces laurentii TaxID=39478 RepID=UPI00367C0054
MRGLGLHDTAFDPSPPVRFRRRPARSARPDRVFGAVREIVKATVGPAVRHNHKTRRPVTRSLIAYGH